MGFLDPSLGKFQNAFFTIFCWSSKSLWLAQIQEVRNSTQTPERLRAAISETVYHNFFYVKINYFIELGEGEEMSYGLGKPRGKGLCPCV